MALTRDELRSALTRLRQEGGAGAALAERFLWFSLSTRDLEGDALRRALSAIEGLENRLQRRVIRSRLRESEAPSVRRRKEKGLLDSSVSIIRDGMGEARASLDAGLLAIGAVETGATPAIVNAAVGVTLANRQLTERQIKNLTSRVLIRGTPAEEFWGRQTEGLRRRFADEMRAGIAAGEGAETLSRRIRVSETSPTGVLGATRAQTAALVRTSFLGFSAAVRRETLTANRSVIQGWQWVATFDDRTTPICQRYDRTRWDHDLNPIGHSLPWPGGGPGTIHFNCRSVESPIPRSLESLASPEKQRLAAEIDRRLDEGGLRASQFGPVPSRWNYRDYAKWRGGLTKGQESAIFKSSTPASLDDLAGRLAE